MQEVGISPAPSERWARYCSRGAVVLTSALLAATFLLISPAPGQTYPGAIPWRNTSILRGLIDVMSLGGLVATERGVEIKALALHVAAVLGLALLTLRLATTPVSRATPLARTALYAQALCGAWVAMSLASALWAAVPDFALSQGTLYALYVAWAVALAHTLRRQDLQAAIDALVLIGTLGAAVCIWYYYERNPHHRPGFPLGSPNLVSTALLPALVLVLTRLVGTVDGWWVGRAVLGTRKARLVWGWRDAAAVVSLVVLVACMNLTRGRGALLGLLAGLAAVLVLRVGRRLRWVLAGLAITGLVAGGLYLAYTSYLDVTMARGATIRFRVYAWRYAVQLWQARPFLGHGAGAYPCLAGKLSAADQTLDPGAFMGQIVEHAHNELFEILTEIGLVGGVTFVGGCLATALAAWVCALRPPTGSRLRWQRLGLVGALAALAADALFGTSPRLPGGPALIFTLLGIVWALARDETDTHAASATGDAAARRTSPPLGRRGLAVVVGLMTVAAAFVTARDWSGVRAEQRAEVARTNGDFATAVKASEQAAVRLLDPMRKLAARQLRLELAFGAGQRTYETWRADANAVARSTVVDAAQQVLDLAFDVRRQLPALPYTEAIIAMTAEVLRDLHGEQDPATARQWAREAQQAWNRQRLRTPYDTDTLLALRNYPGTLASHLVLLRDALRNIPTSEPRWRASLAALTQVPGAEATLGGLLASVQPITPETDLDALVVSMAPETYRLAAAWRALYGDSAGAAKLSAGAAALYRAMWSRFPRMYALSLAEQADYATQADPAATKDGVALLRQALQSLPVIQEQKYEAMAAPFRFQCAKYLLAEGQYDEAARLVKLALGDHASNPANVATVWARALEDLTALGVAPQRLSAARATLCSTYPLLCTPASAPSPVSGHP